MLAFACAFTMFAGAAFTDQADIEATEAVEMLAALGVIDGYEDGSYRPNDTVTRAEMAKMIYVARTGSDNADSYKSAATSFTDITNHWAAGYIKYCQALGIIAGKSTTSFDPDATVTGVEAAKMLLVTMGYQADRAGLEGTGWDQKTLGLASENNLLDDVNADLYAALPRQYAAQVIYNTLDADRVVWSTDADGFDYYTDRGGYRETVGYRYLKLCTDVGTLTTIDEDTLTISISASDVSLSHHKTAQPYTFTKVAQDYSDLLGQKVRVMFKDGKLNDVLGVYADIDNTTYTVNANAVEADGANKIKFNGSSYNVELKGADNATGAGTDALLTYIDGNEANGYTTAELDAMDTSANVLTFADTDGNNKIDTVYVQKVTVAKVTYAASSQIVAGGETYKYADENIADGLAKDDWVVITKNSYNDNFDIVKADMIETTIGGFKDAANGDPAQYRIDGTWYNTYNGAKLDAAAGDTADVVVVNGIVFYADKVSGTADSLDVALVVDTGSFNQAKLAFVDGSTKTVTIDTDGIAPESGKVYCYEVDGEEYKLSALNTLDNDDYTLIAEDSDTLDASATTGDQYAKNVGTTAIDDNAKVVLYSANGTVHSSKLITGKQFKTINWTTDGGKKVLDTPDNDALAALTSTVAGIKKVSVLFVNIGKNMPDAFQSNTNYAYVVEGSYTYSSDYKAYSIFDGSETIEVREKTASTRSVGDIIGYESIEDGVIKDVTLYDAGDYSVGALIGIDEDGAGFTVNGSDHYNVTADTKVILINSDDDGDQTGVPGDTLSTDYEADEIGDSGLYYNNAKYILDGAAADDVDVNVIVVDVVNNKLSDAAQPVAVEKSAPTAADINTALTNAGANGTVVVTGTLPASGINAIGAGQTLVITSQQTAAAVQALTAAAANATIELQVATSDNYNTSSGTKFADGSNAELTAAAIPAGEYVWTANAISSSTAAFDKQ